MNEPKPKPESAAEDLASGVSREFSNFIADIEDLLKQTASLTGDELIRGNAMLSARVHAAKESIQEASEGLSEQMIKGAALADEYVHEQPWKVIGATALAAFALGVMFSRGR